MKKIVLCLMMILAITLFAGCNKDTDTKTDDDKAGSTQQSADNGKKDNNVDVDNEDEDEDLDGDDWRTQRSYTSDYQIKSDLTVCLSMCDDGNGYAVYDSSNGSRIGTLEAELTGDELILCADYDDDGIFELGFGGTPSGDIWFRYVDRSLDDGGCFEEYDFSQMEPVAVDYTGDTDTDNGNSGANTSSEGFGANLEYVDNIEYVDIVNMLALGVYMEDTQNPDNSRYFDYDGGEVSAEGMSEFDCAYLTLYEDDFGESEICFLETGMNNYIQQWGLDGGKLRVDVDDGNVYYGDFYYDPDSTLGSGLYICLHVGSYNVWFTDYRVE